MEILQEKMEKVNEDALTKFLKLLFDRITKDELTLMTSRILETFWIGTSTIMTDTTWRIIIIIIVFLRKW